MNHQDRNTQPVAGAELVTDRPYHLFTLSARTERAVRKAADKLAHYMQNKPEVPLGDLAYSYHVGRKRFAHRLTFTASTADELRAMAEAAAQIEWDRPKSTQGTTYGVATLSKQPKVAFLFTGQGSQFSGMGESLYQSSSVFQQAIDECAEILATLLPHALVDYLWNPTLADQLEDMAIAQPVQLALQYALMKLWMSWGIEPTLVLGHSLGEYAAALTAGVITLQEALVLVANRGRMMRDLCESAAMVSILGNEATARPYLEGRDDAWITSYNAEDQIVLTGNTQAIDELCAAFERDNLMHKRIVVQRGSHCPLIQPMVSAYGDVLQAADFQKPTLPLISNLTGGLIDRPLDAAYWLEHLQHPVRFAQSVETLVAQEFDVVLEIGPHTVLTRLVEKKAPEGALVIGSLKRREDAWQAMQNHLGQLFANGVEIDWQAFDADFDRSRLHIPTTAFDHRSYWLEIDRSGTSAGEQSVWSMGPRSQASADTAVVERSGRVALTRTQARVAEIWENVLGMTNWRPEDDFFESGGESLNVIQVQSRIRETMGVELEFKTFFDNPTLGRLAAHIDDLLGASALTVEVKSASSPVQPAASAIPVAPVQEHYAMSHTQRRLWFLYKLDPNGKGYDLLENIRIEGELDKTLFRTAWEQLVQRQSALRTVFLEVDGMPRQKVLPHAHFDYAYEDLTTLPKEQRQQRLLARIAEREQEPFDLTQGPLLHVSLFRVAEDAYHLHTRMHHIITDGISNILTIGEFTQIYLSLVQGQEPDLTPLPFRYVDYAEWQAQQLASGSLAQEEAFWLQNLAKPLPVLSLPTDFPRPDMQTYNGAVIRLQVPAEPLQRLRQVAKQEDLSLYMLLLSTYVLLLHHLTRDKDMIVGTPVGGRTLPALERMVGFFANTLALRVRLDDVHTLRDLLQVVKAQCLDAFQHQAYPFDLLIEKINPDRDLSRSPIFSTMFVLNREVAFQSQGNMRIGETEMVQESISQFDLSLRLTEGADSLEAVFEYNTDLFQAETMARFASAWQRVIDAFLSEVTAPLHELNLLTDADIAVVQDMNATAAPYDLDQLLLDAFTAQAEQHPERIALSYEGQTMTYGELHARSNQVAHFLRQQGVQRNQLVGILMERGLEMMVGLYGIVKSGAAYVPIDPEYPAQRVQYMISNSEATVVLTKQAYIGQIVDIASGAEGLQSLLVLDRETVSSSELGHLTGYALQDLSQHKATTPERINEPTDVAYMIYTSGSTGNPKGAKVSHRAIINRLLWHQDTFQATVQDVVAQRTSVCFDVSVWELFWGLRYGAKLTILPTHVVVDPQKMHAQLVREGVTVMHFVPSLFSAFVYSLQDMDAATRPLPSLRWIVTSGEALPDKTVQLWFSLFPSGTKIANLYGPTEAAVDVTSYLIDRMPERPILIGRPIANTQLYVLDDQGQICPVGVKGELHIGGVQLAEGYHNNPEKTAEAFIPNHLPNTPGARLYKTGDLARILPDGNIEYLGRKDSQVKVRGYRIELGEIENALLFHENVESAAVLVRKGADGNNSLIAFYTSDVPELDPSILKNFLGQKMPEYMVPPTLVQLDIMPLSPNGKVDRRALAPLAEQHSFESIEFVAPSTPTEKRLAAVWGQVLRREEIGVLDNFFDLGGHSLLAMQVLSRIRETLSAPLELRDLFTHPTVSTLAIRIDELLAEGRTVQGVRIEKAPEREDYALSNAQQRLWFLHQMEPHSTVYHVPANVLLHGDIDRNALEQAFLQLIARHQSLRTVFIERHGVPRQRVLDGIDFSLAYEDLSHLEGDEQAAKLRERLAVLAAEPFDLERGPLLRVALLKKQDGEHHLFLMMHHIITDGFSTTILVSDLDELYRALQNGEDAQLPPLSIQYVDYAEWQEGELQNGTFAAEEAFWLHTLAKPLPTLELPTDFVRPDVQTTSGAAVEAIVPSELTAQLRAFAKQEDVSLFMLLLSGYSLMLRHLTRQDDVIIGTPIAGRTAEVLEGLIGFFVNTLAIRVQFDEVRTVQDLLQKVKGQALDAFQHQTYPFDLLIEKLNPERDLSRTPVFSTMFALEQEVRAAEGDALQFEPLIDEARTSAKFDLSLYMTEGADEMKLQIEYNTHLFKHETAARFADIWLQVLRAMTQQPTEALDALDLLTVGDRAVIAQMNDTAADYDHDQLLWQAFSRQADEHPDRIAMSFEGETMTYGELQARSNQVAHFLRAQGVGRNQLVGVLSDRCLEMVVALYGILKAGAAYVPIDPEYPDQRVQYMIADSAAPVLLTKEAYLPQVAEIAGEIDSLKSLLVLDHLHGDLPFVAEGLMTHGWQEIEELPDTMPTVINEFTDTAYIIYTSGSTGQPKGCRVNHRSVVNNLTWMQEKFQLTEADAVAQRTSFCFDSSLWELFWPLRVGARMVILPMGVVKDPFKLKERLQSERVTVVNFVPSLFAAFVFALDNMPESERALPSLRLVLNGGEALPTKPVNRWFELYPQGAKIANLYGPTETTITVTSYLIEGPLDGTIPMGKPAPNTQIYVLNPAGQICPIGVAGELHVAGIQVTEGYHNKPEKTAEAFITNHLPNVPGDRLYKSGDLVRVLSDGNIEYVGRIDGQVKVRGYRIELGEIENTLIFHENVESAAVIVRKGADGNNSLIAFYTANVPELDPSVLKGFLGQKMPDYMVPPTLVQIDVMPLSPSGKVDRRALAPLANQQTFESAEFVAPSTPTEQSLVLVWEQVLGREEIGALDNFFDMGGHSLLAMQVLSRIRETLAAQVELRDLFVNPTVRSLSAHIDALRANGQQVQDVRIEKAPMREEYVLSNAQQRLWFLHQMEPTSTVYHVPANILIHSALDREVLEQAFHLLIERHHTLRTVFVEREGVPRQRVLDALDFQIAYEDLSHLEGETLEAALQERLAVLSAQPFDLERGPLLRVALYQKQAELHHMHLSMHHIITDGFSISILVKEIGDLYRRLQNREEAQLPPLSIQYVDYAEWQEGELANGTLAAEEAFWLGTLAKPLPTLELPTDAARPDVQTMNGAVVAVAVPSETLAQLRDLARQEDLSMFMLLIGGYALMLRRLTQQDDIIIGTPIAGRTSAALEGLIGFFVNTLAIRVRFDEVRTVQDLLQTVKSQVLDAFQHQTYPFDMLIEKLNPERDLSRTPIFSTMFGLVQETRAEAGDALQFEPLPDDEHNTSKFDLSLFAEEGADALKLHFEYNTDLFKRETVERFADIWLQVLQAMTQQPQEALEALDLLTTGERAVIAQMNDTAADYDLDQPLWQAFSRQADAHPERIALSFEGETVTYGELQTRSNQVAHFLHEQGVGRNQLVGVLSDRCLEMVVALYGILKAGAAYVPIDPEYPDQRVQYMIADSGAPVLLTKKAYLPQVATIAGEIDSLQSLLVLDHMHGELPLVAEGLMTHGWQEIEQLPDTMPSVINEFTDTAYIIYTSGSTGQPKGVRVNHRSVVNSLTWMQEKFQLAEGDAVAQRTSFCFDTSLWELFWPLREGARMVILPMDVVKDPFKLKERLQAERVTVVNFVPSLFAAFVFALDNMPASERALPSLRLVLNAGEALPTKPVNRWFELYPQGAKIANLYGPTETTITVTSYLIEEPLDRTIPMGKPTPNSQLYVLNPAGQICPIGVAGELHVAGIQVAEGYHKKPEKTAEAFIQNHLPNVPGDRLYKTGDLVRVLSDGNIEYVGRIDGQVKVRGYRIELGEIDHMITMHPAVESAAVITRQGPDGNNRLVAYYTVCEAGLTVDALKLFLAAKMPEYMVPSQFICLNEMPLTPSGKIDRKTLSARVDDIETDTATRDAAPLTETEQQLATIFGQILKKDRVSAHDNFFDLGGHSLLAMQVFSQLQKTFDVRIELRDIFAYPTVRELAAHVDSLLASDTVLEIIPPAPEQAHYALSHSQKRLWFLYKMDSTNTSYNVPGHLKLTGELDIDSFDIAMKMMIKRHRSLRTVFLEVDGLPRQAVKAILPFAVTYEDISGIDAADRATTVEAKIAASDAVPFDLTQGPLIRAMLFKLSDNEHHLYLNMHHIITDGWSLNLFSQEFFAIYNSLTEGTKLELPPLQVQYVDYAEWQVAKLARGEWEPEETYWLHTLSKPLPVLNLPTDFTRKDVQTFNGDTLHVEVSQALTQQLHMAAKSDMASLFMLLLAGYQMMLHQLTGDRDIITGIPIAGRNAVGADALIGFFVNTLAIRTSFAEVKTLQDLLRVVKRQSLEAFQHQSYPFDLLIEKVNPDRDMSRTPIFSTMFSFLNLVIESGQQGPSALQVESVERPDTTSKFDLTLGASEEQGRLLLGFNYNTDLFKRETVMRMADLYLQVLQAFATQKETALTDLQLLADQDRVLYENLNDTAVRYEAGEETLHALFEQRVAAAPDQIAIETAEDRLTYAELNARANQVAHALLASGLQKGDGVAVAMERCIETVISIFGVLKAGGAYVPVDLEYPPERIHYMLSDSGAAHLLTRTAHAAHLQQLMNRLENDGVLLPDVLAVDGDLSAYATVNPGLSVCTDDLAYMIYTSGSTGRPKGTLLAHRGAVNLVLGGQEHYGYDEQDIMLQFASYSFDASVCETFTALLTGMKLYMLSSEQRQTIESFADAVAQSQATTTILPNVFFRQVATYLDDADIPKLASFKRILIGGEALLGSAVHLWQQRFGTDVQLVNVYGPTEATVITTVYDIPGLVSDSQANIPIGRALPNYEVYLLNEHLQPCPVNVTGELYIGGVGLAKGYRNQLEKTAEAFVPHPFSDVPGAVLYKSGDLGKLLPDGTIEYLGRRDNQVKIRGFRIEINEIESALMQHEEVEVAAVLPEKGVDGGYTSLLAFFTSTGGTCDEEALKAHLSDRLPAYMVPARVLQLTEMPLLPNGKVDTKQLAQLAASSKAQGEDEYVAPRTPLEARIADVWAACMRQERIGVNDNFFAIGGDSILSMQVAARLNQAGLHISVKDLFQRQTVAELATYIEANDLTSDEIVAYSNESVIGEVPLSPVQQWVFGRGHQSIDLDISSLFVEIKRAIDPQLLQQAMQKVVDHHDMLRAYFVRDGEEVRQIVLAPKDVQVELEFHDLAETVTEETEAYIQRALFERVSKMRIDQAPLMRISLFRHNEAHYSLRWIIHHLVFDGYSSQVVLTDLIAVYEALEQGQTPVLPNKTASFAQWVRHNYEAVNSTYGEQLFAAWRPYLAEIEAIRDTFALPFDHDVKNRLADHVTLEQEIDEATTARLLQDVSAKHGITIKESLLTVVTRAIAKWTEQERVIIDVQQHGRRSVGEGAQLDVNRTVGFFSDRTPFYIKKGLAPVADTVAEVVQRLQELPQEGNSFLAMRYLSESDDVQRAFASILPAQIVYNFIGQIEGADEDDRDWQWIPPSFGSLEQLEHNDEAPFPLVVGCLVLRNALQVHVTYSAKVFEKKTMERLLHLFLNEVRELIHAEVTVSK